MTIDGLREQLESGQTTSRRLCEAALARAGDASGEGRLVFTVLFVEEALAAADASDRLRSAGVPAGPLSGIPISVKDLFDVAGYPTRAGALSVLSDAPPADADAEIVTRLRRAGAVIVGKTNMTEFAYSGLGLNPHHGTPRNAFDREAGRIPGGSSSGAAVSVTDAMAAAAIGTDTGGSVRIPAALCGLTGWKPTAARVPRAGCFPLSDSFDSIGPIATDVAGCDLLDRVLSGTPGEPPVVPRSASSLRLLAPVNVVLGDLDDHVATLFDRALQRLSEAGARIDRREVPLLDRYAKEAKPGRQLAAEAYAVHAASLEAHPERFDPRVGRRIAAGEHVGAAEYIERLAWRRDFITAFALALADYDAIVWPTVPLVAPLLSVLLNDDDAYMRANLLMLRNTSIVNVADGCAITLPIHAAGELPAGLQLAAARGRDLDVLACAHAAQEVLAPREKAPRFGSRTNTTNRPFAGGVSR